MNELAIITQLQQRIALYEDMRAYQELYALLCDRLFRFSHSIVKSREAAEEIVSDVFIKIWQMRNELQKVAALKIYCYTITRNFSINYITRSYKHHTVDIDSLSDHFQAHAPSPEDLLISADMQARIREAIASLPQQCRIIFSLVREDGLRYKEVASILNLSVLTVRNQVAIATRKVAEALPPSLREKQSLVNRFSKS